MQFFEVLNGPGLPNVEEAEEGEGEYEALPVEVSGTHKCEPDAQDFVDYDLLGVVVAGGVDKLLGRPYADGCEQRGQGGEVPGRGMGIGYKGPGN